MDALPAGDARRMAAAPKLPPLQGLPDGRANAATAGDTSAGGEGGCLVDSLVGVVASVDRVRAGSVPRRHWDRGPRTLRGAAQRHGGEALA